MASNVIPDEHRRFTKSQRTAMTRAEADIWRELRAGRFKGRKFRRQVPIGKYVADFVCFDAHLIVELDGEPHLENERRIRDDARDRWFGAQGFRIVRFTNEQVFGNPSAVMKEIAKALEAPSLGSASG